MLQKKEQLELERQILNKTDLLIETAMEASVLAGEEQDRKLEEGIQIVCEMASLLYEYLGGHPEHFDTLLRELTKQKLPDENVLHSFGEFSNVLDTLIRRGLERYQETDRITAEQESVPELVAVNQEAEETSGVAEAPAAEPVAAVTGEDLESSTEEPEPEDTSQTAMAEDTGEQAPEAGTEVEAEPETAITNPAAVYEEQGPEPTEPSEEQVELPVTACSACAASQDSWDLALRHLFPEATINKDYSFKGLTFSYYLPERALAIDIAPTDKREAIWKEYYCRQEKIKLLSLPAIANARPRQIVRTIRQSLAQNLGHNYY